MHHGWHTWLGLWNAALLAEQSTPLAVPCSAGGMKQLISPQPAPSRPSSRRIGLFCRIGTPLRQHMRRL